MKYFLDGFFKGFCAIAPICIAIILVGFIIAASAALLENKKLEAKNAILKNVIEEYR